MTAEAAQKLEKVQKYSTSLKRLFQFLFGLIALALAVQTILVFTGAEPYDRTVHIGHTEYSGAEIPGVIRAIGWIGTALGLAILLKLHFHLIKLFGLYADRKIFSRDNVHQIRQIGITVLLFPGLWVLGVVVTGFLPDDTLTKTVMGGGQDPFVHLIVGTVIMVVSWIMDVGRELREEQDLVV